MTRSTISRPCDLDVSRPLFPRIVGGLSESTTCYVSPDYFAEGDPFADFIAHEVAHIFHNCKRRTLGLRETRTREWLLALATEFGTKVGITDERVDPTEVASIVLEAASERNGWKVILKRCAPRSKPRTALQQLRESLTTDRA